MERYHVPLLARRNERDDCRYPFFGVWRMPLHDALGFAAVWGKLLHIKPDQIRPPHSEDNTLRRLISALNSRIYDPSLVEELLLSEEYASSHSGAIEYIKRRKTLSHLCERWDETLKMGRENITPCRNSSNVFSRETSFALIV